MECSIRIDASAPNTKLGSSYSSRGKRDDTNLMISLSSTNLRSSEMSRLLTHTDQDRKRIEK